MAIKKINYIHKELRQDIKFFNIRIKKYADIFRVKELTLKKKNKVYFLQCILNTKITFI